MLFAGIVGELVELAAGGEDGFFAQAAQAEKRRPAEVVVGRQGFEVNRAGGIGRPADPAFAVAFFAVGDTEQLEQRGQKVGARHHPAVDQAGAEGGRRAQDQRHPHGGVVDEMAMAELAMVAEPFAVVADRHHQGFGEPAALFEGGEHPPQLAVDQGDLAVVKPPGEAAGDFGRRLVGGMGVEVVDPGEKFGAGRLAGQPAEVGVGGLRRLALEGPGGKGRAGDRVDRVVVGGEAAAGAVTRVEHEGGNEGGGRIPGGAQLFAEGRACGAKAELRSCCALRGAAAAAR